MDKSIGIENPYGHVTIPRAQLNSSFVRRHLGEDLSDTVISNPAAVPSVPSYSPWVMERYISGQSASTWEGDKISTQESWSRPYNPYGNQNIPNGGHPESMYTVDLAHRNKDLKDMENDAACCCCKCCPCCCQKCCCVIS
uniref:Cysteine-rich tail protein 1 n=1 Tax=Geotrypetes seraphini TaxID=260995 RepID=A0A6P8SU81_GEOSA|nr:cysteine-rich tail protein 1 [Geotrypetes seraphini]